jgi:hypothetical protein
MKKRKNMEAINLSDLLEDSEQMARGIRIEDCKEELSSLLKFESNLHEPIHRWFKFKEAFSSHLVSHLLVEYFPRPGKSVSFLDPFSGVGTSLLAAEETLRQLGAKRIVLRGTEINSYIRFVADTKLAWDCYNPAFIMRAGAASMNGLCPPKTPSRPTLSTMLNSRFIRGKDLDDLLVLRDKIRVVAGGRREQRPLLLGLAAATENVFNLRKDGRALRYLRRDKQVSVHEEVEMRWSEILEDLQLGRRRVPPDYQIKSGDGRRSDKLFPDRRFDVILFSPPYLNNIDYTEVYKIELWLLGFINSRDEMLSQRRRTFRSHPSCLFPEYEDAQAAEVANLLGPRFNRLLEYASRTARWRGRLFGEYFADMLRTLRGCSRILARDGLLFLIVGNSFHGNAGYPIPVATDLWTCKLAQAAGLKVESLLIGRQLARKHIDTPLLRESVIVMSKR